MVPRSLLEFFKLTYHSVLEGQSVLGRTVQVGDNYTHIPLLVSVKDECC